ncbi:MAG: hypothetical protein LBT50_04910 [Prevotellaceae bacterium]|jgi:hypothetical protein|nr:hypothetical protein [Prevotellaceae bacterium]
MKYKNVREEEIKNRVATDFFDKFDCNEIIENIDFAVKLKRPKNAVDFDDEYLLWAEAKKDPTDIFKMLTQLVLTIGKERTFDKHLPSAFLGCFDSEKIAFVPYYAIQEVFYQNDFNWKIAPSDTDTKEFKQVYNQIRKILDNDIPWETYQFDFENDEKELQQFISQNFIVGKKDPTKVKIDKNNFVIIYNKWLLAVKPSIPVNWDIAKTNGIIDGDFYLADLLSEQNTTLKENLFVVLKETKYELDRYINASGMFNSSSVDFNDKQKAHNQFWNKYERPPKEEYWDFIVKRRDLLVPQDVRERKGSFFTPQIWVELSQKYIADALGSDWQDEYYVWDCAAGTGNLLAGLTNKYNVWASTLDKQDVDVMHDRIDTMNKNSITGQGANLLHNHVFQFDFLNDDFDKLPKGLLDIISNPEKRKKLVIYINPPYAENGAGIGKGAGKAGVSNKNNTYNIFTKKLGRASRELFVQFFIRIYEDIPDCKLAAFSKLKYINAPNFEKFREIFKAEYLKGFVCRAKTFDNVDKNFPICFIIWNLKNKKIIKEIESDVLDNEGKIEGRKKYYSYQGKKYLNDWITRYHSNTSTIGTLFFNSNDFQHQKFTYISLAEEAKSISAFPIIQDNLIEASIYFTVRNCIEATWLNDRDQFLYPDDKWEKDLEFQNDCLAFTLFYGQNRISSKYGRNHWIPFTEFQVAANDKFDSNFMTDFIAGESISVVCEPELFYGNSGGYRQRKRELIARNFSPEAKSVFRAGQALWRYYHQQPFDNGMNPLIIYNVNASLYDIREYFQGRNEKGKMNNKSVNETYTNLIGDLRKKLILLAKKIEPKVYEYGFLKE